MNHPARNLKHFEGKKFESLPTSVNFFAEAVKYQPEIWKDVSKIREMLDYEGHRNTYVDTLVEHVQSLNDVLTVCQLNILKTAHFSVTSNDDQKFKPDSIQRSITTRILDALRCRDDHYANSYRR